MNTKDTPIDYKQFEGHTPEKQAEHYQLYDAIWKIPNGKEFLITVNEGLSENRNLKLELQKQKELNAELVKGLKKAKNYVSQGADMFESATDAQHIKEEFQTVVRELESLIKKSNEI